MNQRPVYTGRCLFWPSALSAFLSYQISTW